MRVAIVTGAARGIGAATALALAQDGWRVLAVDRCSDDPRLSYPLAAPAELDAVAAYAPERITPVVADVTDLAAVEAVVALAEERYGGLDAAIAVAGVIAGGVPLWRHDPQEVDAVLEVNLTAVLTLARAAVPALLRRPEPRAGRFLAVSSVAAVRGLPLLAAYCAAKAGVTGLVRALAAELGGTGVTANAVSPGSTETELLTRSAALYGLASPQDFAAQQAIGRLLTREEVANALVWLAGPQSSGVTGAVLPVDGGLSL